MSKKSEYFHPLVYVAFLLAMLGSSCVIDQIPLNLTPESYETSRINLTRRLENIRNQKMSQAVERLRRKNELEKKALQSTDVILNVLRKMESNFDDSAVSHKGAIGRYQILNALTDYNGSHKITYSQEDMKDPFKNTSVARWYWDHQIPAMLEDLSVPDTLEYRLMAFNWGAGNTASWYHEGADPEKVPGETKAYVSKGMQLVEEKLI